MAAPLSEMNTTTLSLTYFLRSGYTCGSLCLTPYQEQAHARWGAQNGGGRAGLTCLTSAWRCRSWRHCSRRLWVCSALSSSSCCFSWRNSSSSCTWAARSMSFSQINSIPDLKKQNKTKVDKNQVVLQRLHFLQYTHESWNLEIAIISTFPTSAYPAVKLDRFL